jgi:tRNA-modifying protein YgfZ
MPLARSQNACMHTTPLEIPEGACRLSDWGVIRAEGPDAASFLHGQLTQSVTDLPLDEARLGGYCNVKGRLMANFILLREAPEVLLLLLPLDVLPPLLKKLSMFVMRAKVKLQDASSALPLVGVIGDAVPAELPVWGRSGAWLRLPDGLAQRRAIYMGELDGTLERAAWDWLEVHAGLPWVRAATSEHFVPQMINWELLGGVNFKKGCFPGQEVVARSQYRGTVKRRAQLLLGASAAAGSEVWQGEQAVGEVLASATWGGQSAVLAELQLAAWESDQALRLLDSAVLERGVLPYAVKAPE